MKKLVLATGNPGKLKEMTALLAPLAIEVIPQSAFDMGEAEETGLTFVENAILKARHAAALTGLPALADDSGLVIPALHGEPGIYSARYAGEPASASNNIHKVLTRMADVPPDERTARFYCVLALLRHGDDPAPLICQGVWQGEIAKDPAGTEGFGYDPIFFVSALDCMAAELTVEQKNAVSHRGQALNQLLHTLPEFL